MKNSGKKAVVAAALAFVMVFTTPGLVQATTKTTSEHSTVGTYTEYVRKLDSTTELGQMTLTKTIVGQSVTHITKFKASMNCNSVTVYVSYTNLSKGDKTTATASPLAKGYTISTSWTKKYSTASEAKASKTYGKCSVTYN